MTIHVLLQLDLKNDDLPASYDGVKTTLAETRNYPGAQSIEAWVDEQDASKVVVVESWESKEALQAYQSWRASDGVPHALIAALAAPPVSREFTVLDMG